MDISGISEISVQYGIFAGLFIMLLLYVIKTNDKREQLYRETISKLQDSIYSTASESNKIVKDLTTNVDIIDSKVHAINKTVDNIDQKVDKLSYKVDVLREKVNDKTD